MEHQDWFKDWFNSPYYHILYQYRDEREAEFFIKNIIDKINLPKGAFVWDNACGRGRHAYVFSKYGYRVIGTDICENNIDCAIKEYLISEKYNKMVQNLSFFIHDMRREFYVNYFHLSVNLFTSIGYFQNDFENEKVIKVMANSVKNGGFVIIDFFNPFYVLNNIVPRETKIIENIKFDIKRNIFKDSIIKEISVYEGNDKYVFFEKVKLLSSDFFLNALNLNGIKTIEIFGDYSLSPFNKSLSQRMIFLGRKES